MELPTFMALSQIDLTGYPHTACIHLIWLVQLMGGCRHCWPVVGPSALVWMGTSVATVPVVTSLVFGIVPFHLVCLWGWACPCMWWVLPVLVKTETVLLLEALPMLINNVGKSWKESTCLARADSLWNGSWVTCLAWLVPPLATPTMHVDGRRMGRPALAWSFLLR